MPWVTPKTWVTEEIVTSANLNTHLRDNVAWLGADHPRVVATRVTVQNITNGADVPVALTASTGDVGNMHDPAVNSTRLTIPSGGNGMYHFEGFVDWAANNIGRRLAKLRKNGTTDVWSGQITDPGAELWTSTVSGYVRGLVAGDYIELVVVQFSGGTLALNGASFAANWIGT